MHHQWQLFLLLLTIISPCHTSKIIYADHCNNTVPQSTPSGISLESYTSFPLSNGYFSGGDNLLGPDSNHSSSAANFSLTSSFIFSTNNLQHTMTSGIIYVEGTLTLEGSGIRFFPYNRTKSVHHHAHLHDLQKPQMHCRRNALRFELSGFWSQHTGSICMVGNGHPLSEQGSIPELSAVLQLNYPTISNISTSLFTGTIQSLDSIGSQNHFDPISVLVYYQYNYNFTMIPQVRDSCSHDTSVLYDPLGVEPINTCSFIQTFMGRKFRLQYQSDCYDKNCGLFSGMSHEFFPSYLSLRRIQCSGNGRVNLYIVFSSVEYYEPNIVLVPGKSLVGEGFWDPETNRLCLVSCPIQQNVSVGDCTIGLSLWFASVFSIKNRSSAVGHIWSNNDEKDPGHFRMNWLRTSQSDPDTLPGLRYDYTRTDDARIKTCIVDEFRTLDNKIYPNWTVYSGDMRFDLTFKHGNGRRDIGRGYATPLTVGDDIYGDSWPDTTVDIWNVSYMISYTIFNSSLGMKETRDISAEGVYDARMGILCMVGCQYPSSSIEAKHAKTEDGMDCEILISIQLSPSNSENGKHVNATIRSRRKNTDPLYFEPLEVFSSNLYAKEALEMLNRMNAEIVMSLISLTLSLFFTGSQLFHARKYPEVLPSVSITMLVVLTLGHMVPFALNLENLFFRDLDLFLWIGGWIEVNEIIFGATTMVALVLQFRLLQSALIARSADYRKKALWLAEWRSLCLYLSLYLVAAFGSWFFPIRPTETQPGKIDSIADHQVSLQGTLIRYAGWMLDGFLIPQIVVNMFLISKGKALSLPFFVGITCVNAMPRLYDAYRARYYVPFLKVHIYASSDGDAYPRVSNFLIPLGGAIFAVVLYLQQQLGGCFFLTWRSRETEHKQQYVC